MFGFLRRKPKVESPKLLSPPPSTTVECGMCNAQIETDSMFAHWQTHTVAVEDNPNMVRRDGPLRSTPKQRNMVFIVRRPYFDANYPSLTDKEELTVARYFARAIISLKQQRPEMRFQYVPVCMGGNAQFLKTLLVVVEWDEE
ncbi:MAG: hypothetical protein UT67_C0002G0035 [Candidatus Magasanikbacteria bacterium GW2011_GWA2_40_10]|uniref:Uncharacterized protein n=1 Tax=Candidatus Magasanikbacteria bacterium GW2011_GWA2_40_10 TaxID=1619037 RepID=A0A0G0QDM0_9BACT|nr:MAG: hypothetical protein UT67_C0002G0035 [Candidatus Magasanikbacteria bacterium GW2011_GWA2_40_10]